MTIRIQVNKSILYWSSDLFPFLLGAILLIISEDCALFKDSDFAQFFCLDRLYLFTMSRGFASPLEQMRREKKWLNTFLVQRSLEGKTLSAGEGKLRGTVMDALHNGWKGKNKNVERASRRRVTDTWPERVDHRRLTTPIHHERRKQRRKSFHAFRQSLLTSLVSPSLCPGPGVCTL